MLVCVQCYVAEFHGLEEARGGQAVRKIKQIDADVTSGSYRARRELKAQLIDIARKQAQADQSRIGRSRIGNQEADARTRNIGKAVLPCHGPALIA